MPKQHYRLDNYEMANSVGFLLKSALRSLKARHETRFATVGLTFQQWIVLSHVRNGIALTVAALSRKTQYDSGAMTRLIDQLEKRGLIERQRSSKDRRIVGLKLTKEGQKTVTALQPLVLDTLNEALEGFTRQEVTDLEDYLRRIAARWSDAETASSVDGTP